MKKRLMMILAALSMSACGGSDPSPTWADYQGNYPPGWTPAQACSSTKAPPYEFCATLPPTSQ